MFILKFNLTKNNLFINVKNVKGKEVYFVSAGSAGFKGAARATELASEEAGKKLGVILKKKKIKKIVIMLTCKVNKKIKSALKGLFSVKIKVEKIVYRPKLAHNGVREKKRKRV